MAINTITQTAPSCKSVSDKNQYLKGFSRNDYNPEIYNMSAQLRDELEKAIMAGTNKQAFDILCSVETIDHIPGAGNNFVPLNGFAKFYGISEQYLTGVLARRRFILKLCPEDIKRMYRTAIFRNADIPLKPDGYLDTAGREDLIRYRLSDSYGPPCVSLPKRNSFAVYSPRMVLATALSLLQTDKSGENTTAKRVALAIKRSSYRIIKEKPSAPEGCGGLDDSLPVAANGDVVLSRELLTYIIRSTTKEALEGFVETIARSDSKVGQQGLNLS